MSDPRYRGEVLAEVIRNDLVESVHAGHLIELAADGAIVRSIGYMDIPIYPRSSVKALQASAMVRTGLKLNPTQLAVVCASHSGSEAHFEVIRSILSDHGLDERALLNALDKPIGETERSNWGEKPATRIAQNCSGKHAGMLATCVVNGWDLLTYKEATHPLQLKIAQEFTLMSGEAPTHLTADGCGAPLFAMTILGLAKSIHALTVSNDPVHREVHTACLANPVMIAGKGRLTTRLMQAVPGLFMKEGAEGVEVLSLSDGRTLAIKVTDGSWRPMGPIITKTLKSWGIDAPDESTMVYGGGEVVGEVRPS